MGKFFVGRDLMVVVCCLVNKEPSLAKFTSSSQISDTLLANQKFLVILATSVKMFPADI